MMLVEETTVSVDALPIEEFKAHLRLGSGFADDALQDSVLESFLRAAMAAIEARTGKMLIARNFSWSLANWRDASAQSLPIAPVTAITELALITPDDTTTVVDAGDYRLEQDHHRPRIVAMNGCLPAPVSHGQIKISFNAGFGSDFDGLPPDLAQAMLMLAAHYYDNRNATGLSDTVIPYGVGVLIERYKHLRILGGGV